TLVSGAVPLMEYMRTLLPLMVAVSGPTPQEVLGTPVGKRWLLAAAPVLLNSASMARTSEALFLLFDSRLTRLPTALANTSKATPCKLPGGAMPVTRSASGEPLCGELRVVTEATRSGRVFIT